MPHEHLLNPQKQSWRVFILELAKTNLEGFYKEIKNKPPELLFASHLTNQEDWMNAFLFYHTLQGFKRSHLDAATAVPFTSLSAIVAVKKQWEENLHLK